VSDEGRYRFMGSGRRVDGWHQVFLWCPHLVAERGAKSRRRWLRTVWRGWYQDKWKTVDVWLKAATTDRGST
jgi:hypothetical protein